MNKDFTYYLTKFFKNYLIVERNCSSNTIRSYKKTFSLLIEYLVNTKNIKLSNINFETVTLSNIIDFLNYLEEDKGNTIQTRNQRLGAIKSFYQYCSTEEIENISNIKKILSIRSKKSPKTIVNYLTENELKRIFDSIDISTRIGRRDLTLLSLLYDTAARASELINIKLSDIRFEDSLIILSGKGNKKRVVGIMNNTKELLIKYIQEFNVTNKLFGEQSTVELIKYIISKYSSCIPSKKISSHIFRHSRAVHLLDHGVSIMVIKELLGHESIETTQIYATVIEKTKLDAIKNATSNLVNKQVKNWNEDKDLLNQLLNI